MPDPTPDRITGTFSINVLPQPKGQYLCQLSPNLSDEPRADIQCYGQTKEHAIAIALEKLAASYRERVEAQQNLDWDAATCTETGEPIDKRYHIILHYERVTEEESKFDAFHNVQMGNTVVENANITVIEIDSDLPFDPELQSW